MVALNPSYRLTLGGTRIDSSRVSSADPLIGLHTDADLETPAAAFEAILGASGPAIAVGDRATLELGYDDNLHTVFTGSVDRVEPGLERLRVVALSDVSKLLCLWVNQVYDSQTAGGIVTDLATQAGVRTGAVEDGLDLPTYVIEDRRTAYHQCRDLAERAGFDLYTTPEDELTFAAFTKTTPDHDLRYGQHLISASVAATSPSFGRLEVWGESPASADGVEAASWLAHDFSGSRGSAGSGNLRRLDDPALRTREATTASAKGRLAASAQRGRVGDAVLLGDAEVALGDAVRLHQAPDSRLGGLFQVKRVNHRLSRRQGFTTRLELRGKKATLGGLGGLV